ncbi:MAG: ABC transporter substrate-binding protein [Acidobacteriota bacterium]
MKGRKLVLALSLLPALAALLTTSCSSDRPVPIGVVLPLSGTDAMYGAPILRGIELAAAELAPAITLEVLDSAGQPDQAARQLAAAFDAGAPAAIGGVTTAEAEAMLPVLNERERILISPFASRDHLAADSPGFFRVCPTAFREGTKLANYATQTLELTPLASLEMGASDLMAAITTEVTRQGAEFVAQESASSEEDLPGAAQRLLAASPQGIFLAVNGSALEAAVGALRDAGFEGFILTSSAFAAPQLVQGERTEKVLFARTVFDPADDAPPVQSFSQAYRERYGEDPELLAAYGYDALRVLALGLAEKGRLPGELRKGIRALEGTPGVSGPMQFDEKGNAAKFPRVYAVEAGQVVDYEDFRQRRLKELRERYNQLLQEQSRRGG